MLPAGCTGRYGRLVVDQFLVRAFTSESAVVLFFCVVFVTAFFLVVRFSIFL